MQIVKCKLEIDNEETCKKWLWKSVLCFESFDYALTPGTGYWRGLYLYVQVLVLMADLIEDDDGMVSITLRTIGPSPLSRIRVPSTLKVSHSPNLYFFLTFLTKSLRYLCFFSAPWVSFIGVVLVTYLFLFSFSF